VSDFAGTLVYVLPAFALLIYFWWRGRSRDRANLKVLEAAASAGLTEPASLHQIGRAHV
jgi:multisubunit Na+/H+ antiporter MnhG subunit